MVIIIILLLLPCVEKNRCEDLNPHALPPQPALPTVAAMRISPTNRQCFAISHSCLHLLSFLSLSHTRNLVCGHLSITTKKDFVLLLPLGACGRGGGAAEPGGAVV